MSLVQRFPDEIPKETRKQVEPKLAADSICRLLGEIGHELFNEGSLAKMYSNLGRGAINPILLSIVTVLQFESDLPDRAAADEARMRMDWLYALRQDLMWPGFHYSSLCNFRKRLRVHGLEYEVFNQVLQYLAEKGWVKRGRQRTDATHLLGDIERLSRLELMWETLRLAVGALRKVDAAWVEAQLPPTFAQDYGKKRSDFRLSKAEVAKAMRAAGVDSHWLLRQIEQQGQTEWLELEEIKLLAQVLEQQFEPSDDGDGSGGGGVQPKADAAVAGDVISSPHDPDARFGRKGKKSWNGHKIQVTETVNGRFPVITDIAVHSAIETDSAALPDIQDRLEERDMQPQKQIVDGGYCNGKTLKDSEERGIDLLGFVQNSSAKPPGFRLSEFDIDLDGRRAVCPAGNLATSFNLSSQSDVAFHVRFGKQCQDCIFRRSCTTDPRGRGLEISPYHSQLAARRREQKGAGFVEEMHARARIESTISEMVRKHGLRRGRYRGWTKLGLQAAFTAVSVNLKRLASLPA